MHHVQSQRRDIPVCSNICCQRFGPRAQVFNWLPLAAHVDGKILCMHGGIGRSINRIKQIEVLYRPLTMEQGGVVLMDLLWSDPTTNDAVQVRSITPAPC